MADVHTKEIRSTNMAAGLILPSSPLEKEGTFIF